MNVQAKVAIAAWLHRQAGRLLLALATFSW